MATNSFFYPIILNDTLMMDMSKYCSNQNTTGIFKFRCCWHSKSHPNPRPTATDLPSAPSIARVQMVNLLPWRFIDSVSMRGGWRGWRWTRAAKEAYEQLQEHISFQLTCNIYIYIISCSTSEGFEHMLLINEYKWYIFVFRQCKIWDWNVSALHHHLRMTDWHRKTWP